jgi:hypothetical protein
VANLNINGFNIATNNQHDISFSKDGAGVTFKGADGEAIAELLGSGARMQQLKKRPPKIQHLPWVLSFGKGELTLSKEGEKSGVTFGWGDIDGMIVAVREAVKVVNNEITLRPVPRDGHPTKVSFGGGDPFV